METDFPMNAIQTLINRFKDAMPEYAEGTTGRPLRPSDPSKSLGVFPVDWTPDENSFEMGGFGPTLSTYLIRIQLLVKHTDEEEGRALYAIDTKNLRAILYRDTQLRLSLTQLSETRLNAVERVQKMGVRNQRYLNNEIQGTFMFLATTDFTLETEQIPL